MKSKNEIVELAWGNNIAIPAINVSYLPMVKPVIQAVIDENSFAIIQISNQEFGGIGFRSLKAFYNEFSVMKDTKHVRLHLDHVPVSDKNISGNNYLDVIKKAIDLGYQSIMIDGSRLPLIENIKATKRAGEIIHRFGLPCEAKLGISLHLKADQVIEYDKILESRYGFTKICDAIEFVSKSECDWLAVQIGNINSTTFKKANEIVKLNKKLDIRYLEKLNKVVQKPLVLHEVSGIEKKYIKEAIKNGITKVNIGLEIKQAFEKGIEEGSVKHGILYVYWKVRDIIHSYLEITDSAKILS